MDQELKQRLIGVAVITALAVIFVPMLFDDPIDDKGKNINQLKLPEVPAKVSEVEIAPLPEKIEDVSQSSPAPAANQNTQNTPKALPGEDETDVEAIKPKPKLFLSDNETSVNKAAAKRSPVNAAPVADDDGGLDEDVNADKLNKTVQPVQPSGISPAKPVKPIVKPAETASLDNAVKPTDAGANASGTRWYLNAGSFSQKANAVSLQDSLKQQGFSASVKEVTTDKGSVFKVRIGPMLDKAKAQAVKNKLTQININSFVAPDE
jgi:DedD protein